jgi:hypothetical protein
MSTDLVKPPVAISEAAADVTLILWQRGIIAGDPREPVLSDDMHRLTINTSKTDDDAWLGSAIRSALPALLVLLHGCMPQGSPKS